MVEVFELGIGELDDQKTENQGWVHRKWDDQIVWWSPDREYGRVHVLHSGPVDLMPLSQANQRRDEQQSHWYHHQFDTSLAWATCKLKKTTETYSKKGKAETRRNVNLKNA